LPVSCGAEREEGILAAIARKARRQNVTLLFGVRDTEHNNAVVLQDVIDVLHDRREVRGPPSCKFVIA
jgi:hypothetical protein